MTIRYLDPQGQVFKGLWIWRRVVQIGAYGGSQVFCRGLQRVQGSLWGSFGGLGFPQGFLKRFLQGFTRGTSGLRCRVYGVQGFYGFWVLGVYMDQGSLCFCACVHVCVCVRACVRACAQQYVTVCLCRYVGRQVENGNLHIFICMHKPQTSVVVQPVFHEADRQAGRLGF